MSKKHQKRKFIGKMKQPEIWVSEEDMKRDLDFVRKLHPDQSIEESIQSLVDLGYIKMRLIEDGKREFTITKRINEELNKLPPEKRSNYEIKIHETISIICEYNNETTMLLSVIIQQTEKLIEHKEVVPWIIKTHDQLMLDVMGTVKDLRLAFNLLEAKNFVEITENGPDRYRYRLNTPVVQAAINALPEREGESEK